MQLQESEPPVQKIASLTAAEAAEIAREHESQPLERTGAQKEADSGEAEELYR